ncbi:MAG: NADH:flavin oxidoreductase [Gammaproteobacteria bacterium]|nr:NADH:flavin oxidoreductase [Gammaproteobacteria bacterium]
MDPLLQPFRLKHLALKNRIISTSHTMLYVVDGAPQEREQLYHEEKARGGIAMTMFGGSSAVTQDSATSTGVLNLGDDSVIPHFQQFAERIHAYDCALMCQITHLGRRATTRAFDWLPSVSSSRTREVGGGFPKVMDRADIDRIAAAYGEAARRCREGGLDGCEVVGQAHLPEQFWSPAWNRRNDEFGGSLENRLRFGFMVLEEIRRKVGDDFIVGIRIAIDQNLEGGLSKDDCLEIAQIHERSGLVDFLNLNFGRVDTEIDYVNLMPGMSAPKAPYLDRVRAFTRELRLPTFHACRIVDAATARRVIEEGIVDLVGMTRAHIADPHIVRKIEAGEEGRIRPCVGATFCMDHRFCIHNPSTGREKTLPHETPGAQASKRVVVVGGGPAGLEAARVCASRGHEVILLESADRLGGQVALAAKAGWRREIAGVTDWLAGEIGHLGVDVRLSTHAEGVTVTGLGPEVVIVATGGLPDLEWLDGHEHCDSVSDILGGGAAVAKNVLVYDELGDHAGASAAEFLADRGAEVELVFRGHHAAERSGYCNYPVYLQHFYEKGVTLMPDQRLERVERSGMKLRAVFANELTGEMVERLSDQVVVERGTVPADALFEELRPGSCNNGAVDPARLLAGLPQTAGSRGDRGFELYKVGDAVSSRDIHCAILDSRRLCRAL